MRAISFQSGDKWGRLTLTGRRESRFVGSTTKVFVEAECACGACRFFNFREIRIGNITSCGCATLDRFRTMVHLPGPQSPMWRGVGEISSSLWTSWKYSATKRGLQFSVTIKYGWDLFLKQDRRCALSGVPISFSPTTATRRDKTASLDRIDAAKGYVRGNVQWVHKDVNFIKRSLSEAELIDWCQLILNHSGRKQKLLL